MKKILFLIYFSFCITAYSQTSTYHINGLISLVKKNYDLNLVYGKNEDPELYVLIYQNNKEILKAGPYENTLQLIFSVDQIYIQATDTFRFEFYDFDDDFSFTFELNSDDYICSYSICGGDLLKLDELNLVDRNKNELHIYPQIYRPIKFSILSFVPDTSFSDLVFKRISKGVRWKTFSEFEPGSKIQKPKNGMVEWKDQITLNTYIGYTLHIEISDKQGYVMFPFEVPIKEGRSRIQNSKGVIEVETTLGK